MTKRWHHVPVGSSEGVLPPWWTCETTQKNRKTCHWSPSLRLSFPKYLTLRGSGPRGSFPYRLVLLTWPRVRRLLLSLHLHKCIDGKENPTWKVLPQDRKKRGVIRCHHFNYLKPRYEPGLVHYIEINTESRSRHVTLIYTSWTRRKRRVVP